MIRIYTDGGCDNVRSKIGAWAYVAIKKDDTEIRDSGSCTETTSNRMEIQAVIEGLRATKKFKQPITIYSDSRYIVNAMNSWIKGWKKRDWTRKDGKLINADLWKELDSLTSLMEVKAEWVRGHNENYYNEICDSMCTKAMQHTDRMRSLRSYNEKKTKGMLVALSLKHA